MPNRPPKPTRKQRTVSWGQFNKRVSDIRYLPHYPTAEELAVDKVLLSLNTGGQAGYLPTEGRP